MLRLNALHDIVIMIYVYLMHASSAIASGIEQKPEPKQYPEYKSYKSHKPFQDCYTPAGIIQTLEEYSVNVMFTHLGSA